MRKLILLLSFVGLTITAQAQAITEKGVPGKYVTHITAFGSIDFREGRFYIEPADENISPNDLEFKEYAKYVSAYFVAKGGIRVDDIKDADAFILMDYGIGETKPLVYHNPIIGRTGVSSQRTTFYKNSAHTSYSYNYGVVGYDTRTVDQYRKYINLHVYRQNEEENPTPIWKAEITCTSPGTDLAQSIPPMMWNVSRRICNNLTWENGSYKINNVEWVDDIDYNYFTRYIVQGKGESWHGLYGWIFWGKTIKTKLLPYVLYNGDNYTDIIFYVPYNMDVDYSIYPYKFPSESYIEFNGKQYKAIQSFGCEFDKKNKNPLQRTFVIRFERVPDEAIGHTISIYSAPKGKRLYGWENLEIY